MPGFTSSLSSYPGNRIAESERHHVPEKNTCQRLCSSWHTFSGYTGAALVEVNPAGAGGAVAVMKGHGAFEDIGVATRQEAIMRIAGKKSDRLR